MRGGAEWRGGQAEHASRWGEGLQQALVALRVGGVRLVEHDEAVVDRASRQVRRVHALHHRHFDQWRRRGGPAPPALATDQADTRARKPKLEERALCLLEKALPVDDKEAARGGAWRVRMLERSGLHRVGLASR